MAGVIAEATRKIAELGGLEKAMKFLKKGKISEVTSPSGKTLLGHDDEDSSSSYYDISDMPPPPPLDEEAPPAAPSQAAPAAPRQIAPTMASPPRTDFHNTNVASLLTSVFSQPRLPLLRLPGHHR